MNMHQHEHIETFTNEISNMNYQNNKQLLNNSTTENQQAKNIKKLKDNAGHKIILILEEYYIHLEKFLKVLDEYLLLSKPSNYSYSAIISPWLQQEIRIMTKTIETIFTKIRSIDEIKLILKFIEIQMEKYDKKGISSKYQFDTFFISNIKISLEALVNSCMKFQGNSFDLKEYTVMKKNIKINFYCVSEIGNATFNIFQILSEFIEDFLNNEKHKIDLVFLEEYFFQSILYRDFTNFLKNKISKNMANNFEVKTFFENQENLAIPNQILINYGISILSIEDLLDIFLKEINKENIITSDSKGCIKSIKEKLNESKNIYFNNLFKPKLENHFYQGFENNKEKFKDDNSKEFKKPEGIFYSYFFFLKSLAKTVRQRTNNNTRIIRYFVLESLFLNFLKMIESIKELNSIYDTDLNLSKLGINGLEIIIYGVYFVYFGINKIFGFDEEGKYKKLTEDFLQEIIRQYSEKRNLQVDKFIKNKQIYQDNILKFIIENRVELIKGF
jgi:hypothetical protein